MSELLSKSHVCFEAKDGKVALELIAQRSFDLIISDNQMPNLSGVELNKILNSSDKFKTPFILCSGDESLKKEKGRVGLVLSAFFSKPYSMDALVLKVNEVLGD